MKDEDDREASISIPPLGLRGTLGFPPTKARGLVLFAHGSGSSRLSPRNTYVADALRQLGLATLLFDLLLESEEHDRKNVFDIDLLAERLMTATVWAQVNDVTKWLPIGYFGASTGAAAALVAAAHLGNKIKAVVSRGGRPDLAKGALRHVEAPTLLIVGGNDVEVLSLNRAASQAMHCKREIKIVPGATHLFEEPGALETVIEHAGSWFLAHLAVHKDE